MHSCEILDTYILYVAKYAVAKFSHPSGNHRQVSRVAVAVRKVIKRRNASAREIEAAARPLRRAITNAWKDFQVEPNTDTKERIRQLHLVARHEAVGPSPADLTWSLNKYSSYFIAGRDLDPSKIAPTLKLVEPRTIWEDLFKLCRATWSMPYSKGYGRRLRFVVFDEHHKAVIGILGLQSPPADLNCRDELLGVSREKKLDIVNCTLDAYTIGAVPPYSNLLGGKLVASLVASDEVRQAYWRAYAHKITVMMKKRVKQPLLAVTTTSAFGRSSIYNRLKFGERLIAEPIGWTKGYGTVHLEAIYPKIVEWLEMCGELRHGGYGNGPKIRWQNISTALNRLRLPARYAVHGLQRQVFLFRHVSNLEQVCKDGAIPQPIACQVAALSEYWKQRWAVPRALRDPSWRALDTIKIITSSLSLS